MGELREEVVEQGANVLRLKFPDIGGGVELTCSPFLAQAVGSFAGIDVYFRAKDGRWEFETQDQAGHRSPLDSPSYFARTGAFAETKPGVMTLEWAARILRGCLDELWHSTKAQLPTS